MWTATTSGFAHHPRYEKECAYGYILFSPKYNNRSVHLCNGHANYAHIEYTQLRRPNNLRRL